MRDRQHISREDYEVGVLSNLQRAGLLFHERGVGGVFRVVTEGGFHGDAVFGVPAAFGGALGGLAGDGGVDAQQHVHRKHGIVAAERLNGAGVVEFFEGVRPRTTLGAEQWGVILQGGLVGGGKDRLCAGDDAQLLEAREVAEGGDFDVFDTMATALGAIHARGMGVGIERDSHSAVADGVELDLEAGGVVAGHALVHSGGGPEGEAGIVRPGIGFEHGGGLRVDRAIQHAFGDPDAQPRAVRAVAQHGVPPHGGGRRIGGERKSGAVAHAQGVGFGGRAQDREHRMCRVATGGILNQYDTERCRLSRLLIKAAGNVGGCRLGHEAHDQLSRRLFQQTSGHASGFALDHAARGVGRYRGNLGHHQGPRVGERLVAVAIGEHDGLVGEGRVKEPAMRRVAGKVGRSPASAHHPRVGRPLGGPRFQSAHDFCGRLGVGKVGLIGGREMPVGITESRHHAPPLQVYHPRRGPAVRERVGRTPHRDQLAVAHGEGAGRGAGGIAGPDAGVGVDRVGDRGLGLGRQGQRGGGKCGQHRERSERHEHERVRHGVRYSVGGC